MNLATIKGAYTALTGRPQPVLTRVGIASAISVLAALLVHFNGGGLSSWLNVNKDAIAGFMLVAGPHIGAVLALRKVTPTSDPKAADGSALVPASSVRTVQVMPTDPVALAQLLYPAPVTPAAPPA